jgi:hypothetical protein
MHWVSPVLTGGVNAAAWGGCLPNTYSLLAANWSRPQPRRYQHGFSTRSGNDGK